MHAIERKRDSTNANRLRKQHILYINKINSVWFLASIAWISSVAYFKYHQMRFQFSNRDAE